MQTQVEPHEHCVMFMITICNCLHQTTGIVLRLTIAIVRRSVLTVYKPCSCGAMIIRRSHSHHLSLTQPSERQQLTSRCRISVATAMTRTGSQRAEPRSYAWHSTHPHVPFILNRHWATHFRAWSGTSQPTAIILNWPQSYTSVPVLVQSYLWLKPAQSHALAPDSFGCYYHSAGYPPHRQPVSWQQQLQWTLVNL